MIIFSWNLTIGKIVPIGCCWAGEESKWSTPRETETHCDVIEFVIARDCCSCLRLLFQEFCVLWCAHTEPQGEPCCIIQVHFASVCWWQHATNTDPVLNSTPDSAVVFVLERKTGWKRFPIMGTSSFFSGGDKTTYTRNVFSDIIRVKSKVNLYEESLLRVFV